MKETKKLLEFDLNPNIDKPLSKEQLKEMNRIKMEEKYGIGYENLDNYISPLLEEYKLIDTKPNNTFTKTKEDTSIKGNHPTKKKKGTKEKYRLK